MPDLSTLPTDTRSVLALTERLGNWLEAAGVADPDHVSTLTVGLSDSLAAAVQVAESLERMLASDPTTEAGADAALSELGIMHAYLFTELKDHLLEIEPLWEPALMEPIAARLPPDEDE